MSVHDLEARRIAEARRELGTTAVAPRVAALLTLIFLATVSLVPLADQLAGGLAAEAAVELGAGFDAAARELAEGRPVAASRALLARLHEVEKALERDSPLAARLRPWAQALLTGVLGEGNEPTLVGRDGWLFLRSDVEYSTGPPFLDARVLERRRRAGDSWRPAPEPDPRPALAGLAAALAERGIAFVVLATPAKPMAHPERLSRRYAEDPSSGPSALHNASWEELRATLEAAGAAVFEPGAGDFLRTDSHWTPASVDRVAAELAAWIEARDLLPPRPGTQPELRREPREVEALGDLAALLELPAGLELLAPERVEIARVLSGGEPWAPDPRAAVLLLGDSFTNVFSQPELGWGDSAGLAEQLSFHLGRPVDRLAINAGADLALRQRLRALPPERLARKRVVIYQLALRALSEGDWRTLDPPLPPVPEARTEPPASEISAPPATSGETGPASDEKPATTRRVRGTIRAVAALPDPASTPYREAILALELGELEALGGGQLPGDPESILVYVWGLRDRRPTAAASWRPGLELELELVPWSEVAPQLETLQRLELDDDAALFLDAYWAPDA